MSNGSSKPAFPLEWSTFEWQGGSYVRVYHRQHGLTKREMFAMAALQGILANYAYDPPRRRKLAAMAADAVAAADALLAALELPTKCVHPWHENPALLPACPECGEGDCE